VAIKLANYFMVVELCLNHRAILSQEARSPWKTEKPPYRGDPRKPPPCKHRAKQSNDETFPTYISSIFFRLLCRYHTVE